MNTLTKRKFRIVGQYALAWALAFVLFSLGRGIGTVELGAFNPDMPTTLTLSVLFGSLFGCVSGYTQYIVEEKLYRKASLQRLFVIKLVAIIAFISLLIIITFYFTRWVFGLYVPFWIFAFDHGSTVIYSYIFLVDIFLFVFRQITLMLGEANLYKLLLGKFYTPHDEERIFLFVDLRSSTQLAEQLGHITYSKLIQDCFLDLGVVINFKADIYQYVGDEAILTWETKKGLRDSRCLDAFFAFKNQLLSRSEYYEKEYGIQPFFKAGLHAGIVTATEVGKYKREIAYHGDTINTTARIQGKCNELGEQLLVSEAIVKLLATDRYAFQQLESIVLRGKERKIPIYAVRAQGSV